MKNKPSKNNSLGFTLMELLIVLVIVGLLAALVGPTLYKRINPAKTSVAAAQMENFMSALDAYYVDNGVFPSTQEGLAALRNKPSNLDAWQGPYLKKDIPFDPWGQPYVYRTPGRNGGYEILSFGADKVEGGSGDGEDVVSWQ
ncbi:type II secretion system major pseudopilin GspG [Teredinibacter franksiae]|uniref:type II secretion system major pseudopilin GspG n=1 Tax=Teredinibacter franksiae TaxID=2761453 RepID=UPI001627F9A7|nr:type II secretion system major pseudopilin GspG [Teredinibacter franksiae]